KIECHSRKARGAPRAYRRKTRGIGRYCALRLSHRQPLSRFSRVTGERPRGNRDYREIKFFKSRNPKMWNRRVQKSIAKTFSKRCQKRAAKSKSQKHSSLTIGECGLLM